MVIKELCSISERDRAFFDTSHGRRSHRATYNSHIRTTQPPTTRTGWTPNTNSLVDVSRSRITARNITVLVLSGNEVGNRLIRRGDSRTTASPATYLKIYIRTTRSPIQRAGWIPDTNGLVFICHLHGTHSDRLSCVAAKHHNFCHNDLR